MKVMKTQFFLVMNFIAIFTLFCNSQEIVEGQTMINSEQFNIKILIGETKILATLNDNPTTRDFISLLPLELVLEDYAGTEKISTLPKKLSTDDAPSGYDPSVGDITYYAPWGNLAIFYKDFGYASGLIKLGSIKEGIKELTKSKSLNVRIEPGE